MCVSLSAMLSKLYYTIGIELTLEAQRHISKAMSGTFRHSLQSCGARGQNEAGCGCDARGSEATRGHPQHCSLVESSRYSPRGLVQRKREGHGKVFREKAFNFKFPLEVSDA